MASLTEPLIIKIKRFSKESKIPTKAESGAAGYDLYSIESKQILPHETLIFDTGIGLEIPENYVGLIHDRSGMGKNGYCKHGGVIDSSYRGKIGVIICNTTNNIQQINKGNRIAQILFQKKEDVDFLEVEELSSSDRGIKGFGASGN